MGAKVTSIAKAQKSKIQVWKYNKDESINAAMEINAPIEPLIAFLAGIIIGSYAALYMEGRK